MIQGSLFGGEMGESLIGQTKRKKEKQIFSVKMKMVVTVVFFDVVS